MSQIANRPSRAGQRNLEAQRSRKYEINIIRPSSRRSALLLGCGFLLTSCSGTPLGSIANTVRFAVKGHEGATITRARINSIPYATIAAKIGTGPRSLVVLGKIDGEELHWISADRTVLVTRRGRLVGTAGFPANLKKTNFLDEDPLAKLKQLKNIRNKYRRMVDITPPDYYGLTVESEIVYKGSENIKIAELDFKTEVFHERSVTREIDWNFENRYWVAPEDGLIWKSIQHMHPDVPPVTMELLKPANV